MISELFVQSEQTFWFQAVSVPAVEIFLLPAQVVFQAELAEGQNTPDL